MRQETARPRRFRNIKAWQLADELVVRVYQETRLFPGHEQYGLISQMRRAAVSVAANIVEGSSRKSTQEYLQFLYVARASLNELAYYLHLSRRLSYLSESRWNQLEPFTDEVTRTLFGLIQAVSRDGAHQNVSIPCVPQSDVSSLKSEV
jgi:four helix bundle protein